MEVLYEHEEEIHAGGDPAFRANPYTLKVSEETISYTLAFKEAFWALSLQGYTGMAAFRKLGYNTQVLGFERIHNIPLSSSGKRADL